MTDTEELDTDQFEADGGEEELGKILSVQFWGGGSRNWKAFELDPATEVATEVTSQLVAQEMHPEWGEGSDRKMYVGVFIGREMTPAEQLDYTKQRAMQDH